MALDRMFAAQSVAVRPQGDIWYDQGEIPISDDGTWSVTLRTQPAKGSATFGVTVVRRNGTYLVCD